MLPDNIVGGLGCRRRGQPGVAAPATVIAELGKECTTNTQADPKRASADERTTEASSLSVLVRRDSSVPAMVRYKDDDLVGNHEVCERLGVTRSALYTWMQMPKYEFPEPVARLKCGPIWLWGDIRAWDKARKKRAR